MMNGALFLLCMIQVGKRSFSHNAENKECNLIGLPHPFSVIGQRHIPNAEGCGNSVDNGIFIHAIVPRHVETVCCLYHRSIM